MNEQIQAVLRYHELSKHAHQAFAPGPGHLDWTNQPNPFRHYEGAPPLALERSQTQSDTQGNITEPHYEPALLSSSVSPVPVSHASVSQLFFDSLALSAWKAIHGSKWALRINPSSGNLHPTEGYWISGPVPGLCESPLVAHYVPLEHALECRAEFSLPAWKELSRGFPEGTAFVGLTSIHWREAWKYGERAFRYCQHDVGHAIAALSFSAAALGWTVRLIDHWSQNEIRNLLGLTDPLKMADAEIESPDCLIAVIPFQSQEISQEESIALPKNSQWLPEFLNLPWRGKPNCLSPSHTEWPGIEEVSHACEKPKTPSDLYSKKGLSPALLERIQSTESQPTSLRKLIRQRRSAVDFDDRKGITRKAFYDILEKTIPGIYRRPWDAFPWKSLIHLGIYVHRVQDLSPGLYFLIRNPEHEEELRSQMDPSFRWEKPDQCPPDLNLYRLVTGDARRLAKDLSCGQDIAGEGAFSLGMIAQFEHPLRELGPWFYPRLFWECGAIGQILYLEAEAMGIRGTGIGCFFDDPVHRSFGLKGRIYQSLYHFTVGSPVDDMRLSMLPPYPDLA